MRGRVVTGHFKQQKRMLSRVGGAHLREAATGNIDPALLLAMFAIKHMCLNGRIDVRDPD